MRDVAEFILKAQEIYGYDHFINDAGGSLCELDDELTERTLAAHTLILYLKTDPDLERELVQRAIDDPKPLYYQETFLDAKLAEYLAEAELQIRARDQSRTSSYAGFFLRSSRIADQNTKRSRSDTATR